MKLALQKQKNFHGFTLVELLIVIVVIAILAAITIVVYRGVQERARTSAVAAAVDQWEKLIVTQSERGATFPAPTGSAYTACLGTAASDFPATSGFSAGECFQELDGATVVTSFVYDAAFFQNWPSDVARPKGGLPTTTFKFDSTTTFRARGAWITAVNSSPEDLFLRWIPQVSGQCGRGTLLTAIPVGNTSLDGSWCEIKIKR